MGPIIPPSFWKTLRLMIMVFLLGDVSGMDRRGAKNQHFAATENPRAPVFPPFFLSRFPRFVGFPRFSSSALLAAPPSRLLLARVPIAFHGCGFDTCILWEALARRGSFPLIDYSFSSFLPNMLICFTANVVCEFTLIL